MTTQTTKKKKQCHRLTAAEKKIVWDAKTDTNAGAGWTPQSKDVRGESKYQEYCPITPKEIDKEFR
jgi:hypothetical protein